MSAEQFHVDVDNEEVLRKVGIKGTHFNKNFLGHNMERERGQSNIHRT